MPDAGIACGSVCKYYCGAQYSRSQRHCRQVLWMPGPPAAYGAASHAMPASHRRTCHAIPRRMVRSAFARALHFPCSERVMLCPRLEREHKVEQDLLIRDLNQYYARMLRDLTLDSGTTPCASLLAVHLAGSREAQRSRHASGSVSADGYLCVVRAGFTKDVLLVYSTRLTDPEEAELLRRDVMAERDAELHKGLARMHGEQKVEEGKLMDELEKKQ
eukprot:3304952-Rhodomonas_salina.1